MVKVSPSVLSADFARLGDECRSVLAAGADMIHFDVMDGHFVDNISFGLPVLEALRRAFPGAYFDVHLMITEPLPYVRPFAEAGASCITFHIESGCDVTATLAAIRACGCGTGLAVNPDTPVEAIFPYLDGLSIALLMGVVPGHGGQSFRPGTLGKIRSLKAECLRRGCGLEISVDGGIKPGTTAPQCVEAGADILVAGSAVFGAADRAAAVRSFKAR